MAHTPPRIYLIGAGHIGARHVEAAEAFDEPLEVHAADRDPAQLERLKSAHPHVHLHQDATAMLDAAPAEDDLVIVATPPRVHGALACAALESGRHVLCEKPLAMTTDEARTMLATARAHDVRLACCSNRFLGGAASARLRRDLAEGRFGALYRIAWWDRRARSRVGIDFLPETMQWAVTQEHNGGGTLMDWGPYDFTTLHHLISPQSVTVVDAWLATPEAKAPPAPGRERRVDVEFHVGARLRYVLTDGSQVAVDLERAACTHGPPWREALFEGPRGAAVYDFCRDDLSYRFDRDGEPEAQAIETEPNELPVHHRPLHHTLRAIRGETAPAVLDEDAVFNFSVLRAVYEAAEQRRAVRLDRAILSPHAERTRA